MSWLNRRFARLRLALSQTLARAVQRHEPPEAEGREAWLSGARTSDDLWNGVKSPVWAVHLAHHLGIPVGGIVTGGTEVLARSLEGYVGGLPTVLDYGTLEPEERTVESYFAWQDQPLEDLADGAERYEAAALEQLSVIEAQAASGPESSPYRGSAGWPNDLAPRLHRLVAVQHWFAAARYASETPAVRPGARDELSIGLAHALAAQPGSEQALLEQLVRLYRAR
ncbi:MAG: hypothetical protein KUG77_27710 [Nannocystaceae bacterium]|nr:hypothetical protein [Nannocystaceae bacterium]